MKKKSRNKKKSRGKKSGLTVKEMADFMRELLYVLGPETVGDPLHQLWPPPPEFAGRAAELAELREQIESGVVAGVVLWGPEGVGKTALALALAAELSPVYSHAQFYVDSRGAAGQRPLAPADAMAHIIHSNELTKVLPESDAQLNELYRASLRGRRTLLLLDNVADAAQLEALLPPAGCVLLATSTRELTLPGLFSKRIEPLPAEVSRELLSRLEPNVGEHAAALAELCGGLPLTLRLAAGAVRVGPELEAADYLRQLTERRRKLEPLDAVLDLNDELMPPVPRGCWRELAVFPASFDATGAAAAWDMLIGGSMLEGLPSLVGHALDNLLKRGLIETTQPGPEADEKLEGDLTRRYWLHDAARAAAAARLSGEDRLQAERRHAKHFWNAVEMVMTLCRAGNSALKLALELCDRERLNIEAGRAWAVAHAATDPKAAEWAADYLYFGIPGMIYRLRPTEVDAWLREAVAAGGRKESELLGQIGSAYQDVGDKRRSVEYSQRSLQTARAAADRAAAQRALGGLGDSYYAMGKMDKAIEAYQQYLAVVREQGDKRAEAYVLNNLGAIYGNLGRMSEAIECFELQLDFLRESGDREHEARLIGNIGITHIISGQATEAIERFTHSLTIFREIGDREGEAEMLQNLAGAYVVAEQEQPAIDHYEQAVPLHRKLGDRHSAAEALWNLGMLHDRLGNRPRAIECIKETLKLREELRDPRAAEARRKLAEWRT
jgi:tetratricopeptide (TPR) repeat protein